MAKYLDQNGARRLVDDIKTSQSALNTKINSEIVARENFATDATSSIAALDTKIDNATAGMVQTIAFDGMTLSITSGAGSTDTYQIQDTTYDLATTTKNGLMSAADKTKLDGIGGDTSGSGIEEIWIDDVKQTVISKKASLDLSDYAKKADVASVWKRKGSVNSFSDLPANAEEGDVYNIRTAGGVDDFGVSVKAGDNVARTFDGKWDVLAGTVDLSGYVEKVSGKQLSTNDFTDAQKTKLDNLASITTASNGISISGGTIASSNRFDNQVTLGGGLYSRFTESDLYCSTINADSSTIDARNTLIDAEYASIDARYLEITNYPKFNDGFEANSADCYIDDGMVSMKRGRLWITNGQIGADSVIAKAHRSSIDTRYASINASYASINANAASIDANAASISGNPTLSGNVTFTEPIYIDNTGSTVKGALCFDMDGEGGKPRLKMRIPGSGSSYTDFIFNCDTSVTGGTG